MKIYGLLYRSYQSLERKDEPGGAPVRLDRECRNRGLHERVGERIGVYGKATKGGA